MKAELKIVETSCWKCNGSMKLAFYDNTMPPSGFTDKLIALAREKGVVIKEAWSGLHGTPINHNICPHCDSMFGEWYLSNFWYDEPVESMEVDTED